MTAEQILIIILCILSIWNIVIQAQFFFLRKRLKNLFAGSNAADLENIVLQQIKRSKKNEENLMELAGYTKEVENMAQKSIQKVGIIRFNPFKDTGGNQSFSIALLDSFDNGVIISTLFSREGTRVYAKPIDNGQSTYNLSDEEKEAIQKAQKHQ
jgi:hypothetical protein